MLNINAKILDREKISPPKTKKKRPSSISIKNIIEKNITKYIISFKILFLSDLFIIKII